MRLGAYTSALHDRPIDEVLRSLSDMGLEGAEINAGGFLPSPHVPIELLLTSEAARGEYLALFDEAGIALTALNCNGNPLHPDREIRAKHADDLRVAIRLAAILGVKRVVTMSGLPEAHPSGRMPSWPVVPWDSVWLDVRDYQWHEVAIPFWRSMDELAREHDVRIAIEMHPGMLVYNPATMERLADAIDATNVGAEMDPSHLFWQGIDPILAIERLGGLVYNAAAKDTRINEAAKVYGVLDDRHARVDPSEPGAIGLGGPYTLTRRPTDAAWDFVAVGRGHDVDFWARFLAALEKVDPDMAVNIEHEDLELDQLEGFRFAAATLLEASKRRTAPG